MPKKIIKKEIEHELPIPEIQKPEKLIELTPEVIARYHAIDSLRKWKQWSLEHPNDKLFEQLDEKSLSEKLQEKPEKDNRTLVEIVQEKSQEDTRTLVEKIHEIPKQEPLPSDTYQFPYHYSIKAHTKNLGYKTFGVYLPNYYNVKSLSDRHIIFQYILAEYESAEDEEFENEIYHFGFGDIEAILLIAPGGMREEWKESRII